MRSAHVVGGQRGRIRRVAGPVRIEPGVQLQPALVGLLDGKPKRIVRRIGRASLRTRQVERPRLVRRLVERVGVGPHLKNHRVQVEGRGLVEHVPQLRLLLLNGQARLGGPVDVGNCRNPGGPKLAGRGGKRHDLGLGPSRRALGPEDLAAGRKCEPKNQQSECKSPT